MAVETLRPRSWWRSRRWAVAATAMLLVAAGIAGGWTLARSRRPTGHWAAVARGREYLGRGRPDLALKAVEHVRDEAPGAGEAMAVAGLALHQMGQWTSARLALERALRLQPNQRLAARTLATMCLRAGDAPRGLEYLRLAARLDPKDPAPWLVMGRVEHDLAHPALSADAFEQALRRDPASIEAAVGLIGERLAANEPEQATAWLDRARKRRPDDPRLLGLAARHARDLGRPAEALNLAARALGRDPDNLDALLTRARIRLADGQADAARPDLERAVAARPNDLAALQMLAQAEARAGLADRSRATAERHRRARERAEEMARISDEAAHRPDDPEPRCRLGRLAAEGGSLDLAEQCFRAALEIAPRYQPARAALAELRAARAAAGTPAARAPE